MEAFLVLCAAGKRDLSPVREAPFARSMRLGREGPKVGSDACASRYQASSRPVALVENGFFLFFLSRIYFPLRPCENFGNSARSLFQGHL